MCAWTHTADGKPISKNFQDRADYMVSGTAKIDITKEHFRIQDSVSDPTAHSVVMATDKLEDNVPLTDQRGGPVTQLQLDDAVSTVEQYLEWVDNNIVHNNGINGKEWITAQFFFTHATSNDEPDGEAVEKELAQPVSISVGRTAAEECEWLWKNTPVQFEEACKEFGCTPEEMIALAEKEPEAYYKYRNAYGYGDEEFGCYACEAEVIDTPVNSTADVTKLDNEGLGVARTDTSVGERLAAVEAGELGVLSRDTNNYEASITLRSPNIYDTTVLGLHEPEIHVHSKVGTSQVQRYFTFPTNGGVIEANKPWVEAARCSSFNETFDLSGYTEVIIKVLTNTTNESGSGTATLNAVFGTTTASLCYAGIREFGKTAVYMHLKDSPLGYDVISSMKSTSVSAITAVDEFVTCADYATAYLRCYAPGTEQANKYRVGNITKLEPAPGCTWTFALVEYVIYAR